MWVVSADDLPIHLRNFIAEHGIGTTRVQEAFVVVKVIGKSVRMFQKARWEERCIYVPRMNPLYPNLVWTPTRFLNQDKK